MAELLKPRIRARLDAMAARLAELEVRIQDPAVLARSDSAAALHKELGSLRRIVAPYEQLRATQRQIEECQGLLVPGGDSELAQLAGQELPALEVRARQQVDGLVDLLLAETSDDRRNAILEIRAGTGGEEAALFARDLMVMYQRYCERQGFRVEVLSESAAEMGGFREIVCSVTGQDVFRHLQFESGGHRVQRVPATESQGRIHTSTATVAVLPEAEEVDVEIRDADLDFQAVRASGPGGQNVNKVSSAVRLTHRPSGLVVFCQEERSQHKNRARAMKLLRTRLMDRRRNEAESARAEQRRNQIGSGERSDRIRTYNFPQDRVTDHRIQQNFSLGQVMAGKLEPVVEALLAADRERRIEEL
ncbi:MAG: peptide chain release factor 1 [Planctomycetes bacterium]|nr:peptide chain release factor 1 [Planctomycetota bacterium]